MTKQRSDNIRSQNRKAPEGEAKAKLSSRTPSAKSGSSVARRKSGPSKGGKLRLHQNKSELPEPTRPIPWWVVPEAKERTMSHGPGHIGPGSPIHAGPGPGGPGHFPPPRPPFHGPGPIHPGPGPIPIPVPVPIPGPFPVPVPLPIPPQPFPPGPSAFVNVTITGGVSFPGINVNTFVPFFPGMTIRQALASTGFVGFGPGGFIASVGGIPVGIGSSANVRVFYNGQIIPQTLLDIPVQPGSVIGLELFYSGVPLPTPF